MHRNLVLVQPYFHLISKTRYFLLPWMLFILLAGLVLITYSVSEIHLAVNSRNNGFLDFLMPWVTLGADGWTIVVACLLAIAWHRRAGIFISLACLFTSGITWLLKSTIYQGEPRPKWYFTYTEKIDLHYVPGVENWMYDSFPSGHTTVAFAFFFSLAICLRPKKIALLFFFAALAVGYSRIYLSQHFLLDVFFGSLIGTIGTLIVFAEASRLKWITIPVQTHRQAQDENP
jgi:membrane-associated phospholipid phosphatase